MNAFLNTLRSIAGFNQKLQEGIGRIFSWLVLALTVLICGIILVRNGLGYSSIASQDLATYLHAIAIMFCLAYAAKHDAHVRVDIFYRRFQPHNKAWVNLVGNILFLLPFSKFLLWSSAEWVLSAWAKEEASSDSNGLAYVYMLKTLIPIAGVLLAIHAIGDSCRHLVAITEQTTEEQA